MKQILTLIALIISHLVVAQNEFRHIDFIKVLNNNHAEANYFFENNWKVLRENAIKKGYIKAFDYAEVKKDGDGGEFDIILMTTFSNKEQVDNVEKNFAELIKENGETKFLNKKQRNEIVKIVSSHDIVIPVGTNPEEVAVKKVIVDAYFKGVFNNQDSTAMGKGFHPEFAFYFPKEKGELGKMPLKEWQNRIEKRKADSTEYAQRMNWVGEIKSIDLTGHAAAVKIEIRNKGKLTYTDYLQLLKFDTGWRIVGKIFYGHP